MRIVAVDFISLESSYHLSGCHGPCTSGHHGWAAIYLLDFNAIDSATVDVATFGLSIVDMSAVDLPAVCMTAGYIFVPHYIGKLSS